MAEEKEDLKRADKTQERIRIIEIIISEMKTKLGTRANKHNGNYFTRPIRWKTILTKWKDLEGR